MFVRTMWAVSRHYPFYIQMTKQNKYCERHDYDYGINLEDECKYCKEEYFNNISYDFEREVRDLDK